MYRGKRKYKHLGLAFKEHIVRERLKGEIGVKGLAMRYGVSPKEIRLWTKRYLAGEPLKMKMGRPRKHPDEEQDEIEATPANLRAENKQLKAELAYKNELIKLLEERRRVKKKTDSSSSKG
jgi:transposase-like protein